jgi:hypothetical protein
MEAVRSEEFAGPRGADSNKSLKKTGHAKDGFARRNAFLRVSRLQSGQPRNKEWPIA